MMTERLAPSPHPGRPLDPAAEADLAAIRRLVDAWGFARDGHEWEALADLFHPDGTIAVSWFSGSFADFVEACRRRQGGPFSKHAMAGSRVSLNGHRAVAETDVLLFMRGPIDGVEIITQTNMRFLDRIERRQDRVWRILDRVAIYDHDVAVPAIPGTGARLDLSSVTETAPGHRFLSWRLRAAGATVPENLPAPGNAREAEIKHAARAWLAAAS